MGLGHSGEPSRPEAAAADCAPIDAPDEVGSREMLLQRDGTHGRSPHCLEWWQQARDPTESARAKYLTKSREGGVVWP